MKLSLLRFLRRRFILVFFMFLLFLTTMSFSESESENLDFKLYDIYGREVRSSDYLGVPVFFEFGACW